MASSPNLEPGALAPVLYAAIQRLGEPGFAALVEHILSSPPEADFDAGYDLLYSLLHEPVIETRPL